MEDRVRFSVQFYQKLGKLFYAIAAVDKNVREVEYEKLKEIVRSEWLAVDDFLDDFHTDAAYQIEAVFDWLLAQESIDADVWYTDFIEFKNEHKQLFPKHIKALILKTANAIAASFLGKNKSELILLARLEMDLK